MIQFGRAVCGTYTEATRREWLVTNGLGGYASGTISGALTRHYHGLLVASLRPPVERMLTAVKFDETVMYADRLYPLFTNSWEDGGIEPRGYERIERFYLHGTIPVWEYALADALVEKCIWMEQGANTTFVRYTLLRGVAAAELRVKAIVDYRDHHGSTRAGSWSMHVETVPDGLQFTAYPSAAPYRIITDGVVRADADRAWYRGYFKAIEEERGTGAVDDHCFGGEFTVVLQPGQAQTFAITTEPQIVFEGAYERRVAYERALVASSGFQDEPEALHQLVLAADQFIARRDVPGFGEGRTLLAGFPWFNDWGRDTMIALPGLTLAVGRPEIADRILRTFAHFVHQGLLPNNFPELGQDAPGYNTVDATLWYFQAVRAAGDPALIRDLFPVFKDIIAWHRQGTRYSIHVDPSDGLLYSGEAGVQLTWMDVKIGDWVVTPRTGKAVEINALWYNALLTMAEFAEKIGEPGAEYRQAAAQVREQFRRFWNGSYCFDVIDTPDGYDDATLRPNQLFAVSLPHSPLEPHQQKSVVDNCAQYLLTSHGLRSLSPDHEGFIGRYRGDQPTRDAAYHQGTVWAWLIGAFIEAHLRVYQDPAAARRLLEPLLLHLQDAALGTISEIFEGDAPFRPVGCFAQAWSVSEILRVWPLVTASRFA